MDWNFIYTSFAGRINRQVFWVANIILWVIHWVVALVTYSLAGLEAVNIVATIVVLALLYPSLAVAAKRWHDRDKSAWWILIILVPIVGFFWYLIECGFLRGTDGPNRYGPDPLAGA